MENEFMKLYHSCESYYDLGMTKDIEVFFEETEEMGIKKCDIQWKENRYVINIVLNDYSVPAARDIFYDFLSFVAYSRINMYITSDSEKERKYLFLTSLDGVRGIKMEINIR